MLVPYLSQFYYSLVHRAGQHSAKLDALSRRTDHKIEGEDNEDQVMLPAERFDWPAGQTGSRLGLAAEVSVTSTDTTRVWIDCKGPQFLDCI